MKSNWKWIVKWLYEYNNYELVDTLINYLNVGISKINELYMPINMTKSLIKLRNILVILNKTTRHITSHSVIVISSTIKWKLSYFNITFL